ncbi:MAG: hypothetical protein ACRD3Q_14975 [Terriglobales bacterium]
MGEDLNSADFDLIIESLNHYKTNIENYRGYPSYEFKRAQLERVESVLRKLNAVRATSKKLT